MKKLIRKLTIQKWEHWMIQWMEAYRDGKSAKDAQFDVKKYAHGSIPHTVKPVGECGTKV